MCNNREADPQPYPYTLEPTRRGRAERADTVESPDSDEAPGPGDDREADVRDDSAGRDDDAGRDEESTDGRGCDRVPLAPDAH